MKNEDVAYAWAHGRKASAANLSTDGRNLYSYNLLIGYTNGVGDSVARDYTASGGGFYSVTTSTHVGHAKRYADRVEAPG